MGLIPDRNKPNIPKQKLEEYNILIFSPPGYGKTSFLNAFNNCLLTLFEDSAKAMLSNDINLSEKVEKSNKYNYEWEMFKDITREFMQGEHDYKTMGVDTITRSYNKAMEYMKNVEFNGMHPSLMMADDDSSGYSLLNEELQNVFGKILNSNYGTILSAHADYKKITTLKGLKVDKLLPDTGGSFGKWIMGEVDIVILLDKNEKGERIFRIEGTQDFDAKQRLPFEKDEIVIETDEPNPGKYMYKVFKKEFEKAIEKTNKAFGVTQEMIDEYYQEEKKEKEIKKIQQKIIEAAKDKGITPTENANKMKEIIGYSSVKEINDLGKAKKYLDYLVKKE